MLKYNRILLKLSGEALMAGKPHGIDTPRLMEYATAVKQAAEAGAKIGIVIGGGNIFRGLKGAQQGFDRVKGDYMGMLATVINGLAVQSALESVGVKARVLTAIPMEPVGERYSKPRTMDALNHGEVVIFTFGTGNPFFTTDTAAALRAVEMEAEVLLKGTRVDGVYTADPEKDPAATRFDTISFDEAYTRGLNVMDHTAYTMCKENNIPCVVFDMNRQGNLLYLLQGQKVGTLVHP